MIHHTTISKEIIELRQLEEAARVRFDEAKNELIRIKKKIKEMERLLEAEVN